jgi:carboxylesterase type B
MVWIHGGSYVFGAGDAAIFDPRALVEEQGVIVVSVTYRLGLFGFLGGSAGRAANLGLLDIIEALRWVKRNIQAFGGAPDCVTLFGQSAGAYRIDWGSKTNGFGATHAIDLPLLFGDERAWSDAELVHGIDWADIRSSGRAVRDLWARFAQTGSLPDQGHIDPRVLSYSRIRCRAVNVPREAQSEQMSACDRQT